MDVAQSPLKAVHDAASGLHDIKALPDFSPINLWVFLLIALLVAAVILFFWFRRKKQPPAQSPTPPLPPHREALEEIRRLKESRMNCSIDVRGLMAALSVVLRRYIERSFGIPAVEQTLKEVRSVLPAALKKALPLIPQEKRDDLLREMERVLRLCQRVVFSRHAETDFALDSDYVAQALDAAESSVRDLAHWLAKEEERTKGVIARSQRTPSQVAVDYDEERPWNSTAR